MVISMKDIKKLREETGAGVMDAKRALEQARGDMKKAKEIIAKQGVMVAVKKADRKTAEGCIFAYVHHNGKTGSMVELNCETDFVARNENFKKLAQELAMQVVSMAPHDVDELLGQEYVRDQRKKIKDLITDAVGKIGENITLKRFVRFEVGGK